MMFWLKVKGKIIALMFSSSLGKKRTNVRSNRIESFVLQLYGSRHDTLGAAQLDKFKNSQITTCAYYHQERKLYTNIFIVHLLKPGICEESV